MKIKNEQKPCICTPPARHFIMRGYVLWGYEPEQNAHSGNGQDNREAKWKIEPIWEIDRSQYFGGLGLGPSMARDQNKMLPLMFQMEGRRKCRKDIILNLCVV